MSEQNLIKEHFNFKSANMVDTINGFIIRKNEPPYKAILQISHGMQEHSERYQEFINYMAINGYVVVINDHLGHKSSVLTKDNLGFIAENDGYKCILNDLATVSGRVRKNFPQLKLFLLGHSMGSFYARVFAAKYPHLLDGLIISGTGGKNKAEKVGKTIINTMIKLKGTRHRSTLITNIIFGNFQKYIDNPKTKNDWLSRDEEIVKKYCEDEYCTFTFTLAAYRDLITINSIANSHECFKNSKKDIPYFIFSGDKDPVGNWGKGVVEVYENYRKNSVSDIEMKLYEGGRHEMLNEINRNEVYKDILMWLNSKI